MASVMYVIVVENNELEVIQEVKSIVELVVNIQSRKSFDVNVVIRYYDKANDITKKWLLLSPFFSFLCKNK
jgi:hypothetical protein